MLTDLTVVSAQPKPVSVGRSLPWASSQPRKCLQPHCRNVIHPGWQLDTCLPCLHLQQANHQPPVKAINLSRSHTRKGHHDLVDISRTQRLSNKVTPAFAAPLVPVPPPQAFPHRSIDGRSFPNTMIPHYNARGELFEVDEDGNVILDPQTLINTSDKGKVIDSRSPLEPGQSKFRQVSKFSET
ncbi:hypothetical protein JAAARDRAFT_260454 [Jaapia argillacea MUCL 33604]|uniref:Uncharacterized protein n=1 Tax=Jaapia argillacea MUCL 33604 TaxID=933084 RepID=A0A067PTY6_9AGAM|nr:hypothetical protein JAAARDRAFT_260454 [Jaapia argillacea MUCL 33604]